MPTQTPADHATALAKLNAMIDGIGVAMLTTVEEDGSLRSRPMAAQQFPTDGLLWFFTHAEAGKVREVRHDEHVNLAYSNLEQQRYVSISGRARLVRDRAMAEKLWSPLAEAWFPNGLDDPNLGLLRIAIEKAEYWDAPTNAMTILKGFAQALLKGQGDEFEAGEREKLDLRKGS